MDISVSLLYILPITGAVIAAAIINGAYKKYCAADDMTARAKSYALMAVCALNVLYGVIIAVIVGRFFVGRAVAENVALPCIVLACSMLLSALVTGFMGKSGIRKGVLAEDGNFAGLLAKMLIVQFVLIIGVFFLAGKIMGIY